MAITEAREDRDRRINTAAAKAHEEYARHFAAEQARDVAATITDRVIDIALSRKGFLLSAHADARTESELRFRYIIETASVWAENARTIVCDVPDTATAVVHGAQITSRILDLDVTEAGAPAECRDRAEITQLSPTRARLTF